MSEPFIGQVIAVGFNFAPVGWPFCNGSLLPISEYDALFNLLGTTYGGDGVKTFGLPDLRGRAALGHGRWGGAAALCPGPDRWRESITLTAANSRIHTHALQAAATATTPTPGSSVVLGTPTAATPIYATVGTPARPSRAARSRPPQAADSPHENRQPSLTINYIISLSRIFPSQS